MMQINDRISNILQSKYNKNGFSSDFLTHAAKKAQQQRGLGEKLFLQQNGHNQQVHEAIYTPRQRGFTRGGNKQAHQKLQGSAKKVHQGSPMICQ